MLRLQAISVAAGARLRPFSGDVHTVFDHACNLAVGRLIHAVVVTPAVGNVVRGLMVATPTCFAFGHHISVGMPASYRHGILRIGPGLTIDTRGATIWDDSVRTVTVDLAQAAQRRSWCEAWTTLGLGRTGRIEDLSLTLDLKGIELERRSVSRVSARTDSIPLVDFLPGTWDRRNESRRQCLSTHAAQLIGAGPGLTPAGDDLLVGYIAGLISSAGAGTNRLAHVDALCAAVHERLDRTNSISRLYLLNATEGRVAERLRCLLQQISMGAPPVHTREATKIAMAIGSSSGSAGVLGLLLGLAAWQLPYRAKQTEPSTAWDAVYHLGGAQSPEDCI